MALAPLFPLAPGFWALLLLQLVSGAAVSFAWSGAQTLITQLAEGDAGYIGKFSFFARLGSTTAPILAGMVWDFGGAWPAYLIGAAWGAILTIALLRTREAEIFAMRPADGTARARFRARDALPRASDYVSSIMLVAIPAVAVSMASGLSLGRPRELWKGPYSHGMSSSCGLPGLTSSNYDVSPDGQHFLMIKDDDRDSATSTEMVLVQGWAGELDRASATA